MVLYRSSSFPLQKFATHEVHEPMPHLYCARPRSFGSRGQRKFFFSRPFVSDTSAKCIDRKGLERRRTGNRQGARLSVNRCCPLILPPPRRAPGEMNFIRLQVSPVIMTVESKMASPDLLSYGFSVIVALGGVIGYMKAGWY